MVKKYDDVLKTPKVGERIATVDIYYGIGRKGRRLKGYSDPAKKLAWVRFDDGEVLGVDKRGMVREKDFKKTLAFKLLNKR